MSITSRFYYKNILKRAEDGLGDGTRYATATGATPDQTNKKFTLAGLAIIADLGADANDKFNGFILYFPASGNRYHVIDWDAAADDAYVYETPDTGDTTACEMRLSLAMDAALVNPTNPAHLCCDGKRHTLLKGQAANTNVILRAFLPNFVSSSMILIAISTRTGTLMRFGSPVSRRRLPGSRRTLCPNTRAISWVSTWKLWERRARGGPARVTSSMSSTCSRRSRPTVLSS